MAAAHAMMYASAVVKTYSVIVKSRTLATIREIERAKEMKNITIKMAVRDHSDLSSRS